MNSADQSITVAKGVYERMGVFYIRPTINGARTWRKLSATNLEAAVEEASEINRLRRRAKLGLAHEPLRPTDRGKTKTHCQWTRVEQGWWESGCGGEQGIDDGPLKFGFKFCPYCGHPISEKRMVVIDAHPRKQQLLPSPK